METKLLIYGIAGAYLMFRIAKGVGKLLRKAREANEAHEKAQKTINEYGRKSNEGNNQGG